MAKVIESDPMIVANLLKAANSPLYGFGKEIKNAAQAVSLFGMSMTRSIALGNSIRKLLNVDLQPYGISPDRFAELSLLQATLMLNWYKRVDKAKAERLYLASLLQESGKIVIASEVIQNDETTAFASEVENSNNLAQVERSFVEVSTSEVTALIFEHWNFDKDFIEMIRYADHPESAPEELSEYAHALNVVKAVIPINKPLHELSINIGLKKAQDAGLKHEILQECIEAMLATLKV